MWGAENSEEIIKALSEFINMDEEIQAKICRHIMFKCKSAKTKKEREAIPDKKELVFLTELLERNGVMTRINAKAIFSSEKVADRTAKSLCQKNLIDKFPLSQYYVIYLLKIELYHEVINGVGGASE